MSAGEKVVQTVLDEDEYERFRRLAEEHDLSIKEAARQALTTWTDRESAHSPSDPLFGIDSRLPEEEDGPETSAARTDDYLYGDETDDE